MWERWEEAAGGRGGDKFVQLAWSCISPSFVLLCTEKM